MNRRTFVQQTAFASLATSFSPFHTFGSLSESTTHILSFSFDDGFKQSFLKIADIFEEVGLRACFNVIASGHMPSFEAPDDYILPELMGEWETWNQLVARGHEVMPHGWRHAWLSKLPLEEAKDLIKRSIDYFEENLDGFDRDKAVFNFPFNATTPEIEAYTLTQIGALRSWGNGSAVNKMPQPDLRILGCTTHGPDNIDRWVKREVKQFLKGPSGWFILNVHGLDGEGWGPMSSKFLRKFLARLGKEPRLEILPVAGALFGDT